MILINTSLPYVGYLDSQIGGRAENQDSCGYADTDLGLLVVVCDGMGGGPGGKTASALAVQTIIDCVSMASVDVSRKKTLRRAIERAHEVLLMKQVENPALKGMGTTVVALLINEYSALVAHAGDSRLYQYRRGSMIFRTSDHSMVAELVKAGTLTEEQARLSAQSNVINRALGHGKYCEVDIDELPYEAKDRFLLCTDGVWGIMPQKQLIRLTAQTASLSGVIESTVIQVNENGRNTGNRHDNLTLVILETRRNSKLKQEMSTRVRNLLVALAILCCLSVLGNVFMYNMWKSKSNLQVAQPQDVEKLIESKLEEQKQEYESRMQKLQNQLETLTDEKQELEELLKNKGTKPLVEEEVSSEENEFSDLVEKLDEIIAQLENLKEKKAGKDKNKQIEALKKTISGLKPELLKAGIKENEITGEKGVIGLLSVDVVKEGPTEKKGRSQGQYKAIIEKIKSIKQKL